MCSPPATSRGASCWCRTPRRTDTWPPPTRWRTRNSRSALRRIRSGSFTDPEYAQVGRTEAKARQDHEVVVATVPFAVIARPIIDGRADGVCKLIVDRNTRRILGCHVVGERAVEIAQVAAVAVAAAMPVEEFVRIPLSFPTYTNVLGRAAVEAARQLDIPGLLGPAGPAPI